MSYRKARESWQEVATVSLLVGLLWALEILVVWLTFNFVAPALQWPTLTFFEAGALYVLVRALLPAPIKRECSK